jgi:hypothetical protein
MKINELLLEAGLSLGELRKHGGKYFDKLVDKIKAGETFEVEPSYARQFPDGVVIDPKVVDDLLAAFYPEGDKQQAETDDTGKVVVVDSNILRTPLKVIGTNKSVPFGALTKTKEFKGGRGINIGIIAEGVLGAALTAKFVKKGENITVDDIGKILSKMKPTTIAGPKKTESVQGVYIGKIKQASGVSDDIKFVLKLSKANFDGLVSEAGGQLQLDPQVKSVAKSAVMYVNGDQQNISNSIKIITKKANKNLIEVTTDGISDNKGTKADLTLRINNQVIKLISLKAMGSPLFGQVSGSKFENFEKFTNELFDVDISKYKKKFKDDIDQANVGNNFKVITEIYNKIIGPEIQKQLKAGPASEAKFIEKMANGIIKHATLDKDVEIVKFDKSVYGGVKVLKFDQAMKDALKKIKFSIVTAPDSARLEIYGKTDDPELAKKLGTKDPLMLVKLRSYYQPSVSYVRNMFEMGPLLEDLTTVDKYEGERPTTRAAVAAAEKKAKDIAVGKITKKGERDVRAKNVPDIVALGRKKKS